MVKMQMTDILARIAAASPAALPRRLDIAESRYTDWKDKSSCCYKRVNLLSDG